MDFKNPEIIDYVMENGKGGGANPVVLDTLVERAIEDSQVQPDWNENDESAKGYIKNRPGGYITSTKTFLGKRVKNILTGEYQSYIYFPNGEPSKTIIVEVEIEKPEGNIIIKDKFSYFCEQKRQSEIGFYFYNFDPSNKYYGLWGIAETDIQLVTVTQVEEETHKIPSKFLDINVPIVKIGEPGLISIRNEVDNNRLDYSTKRMAINSDISSDNKVVAPCNFRVVETVSHSQLFNTLYSPVGEEEIVVLTALEDLEVPNLNSSDFPIKVYSTSLTYINNYPVVKLRIIKNNGDFGDIYLNPFKADTSATTWTSPITKLPSIPENTIDGLALITKGDEWDVGLPISFYPVLISHNSESALVASETFTDIWNALQQGLRVEAQYDTLTTIFNVSDYDSTKIVFRAPQYVNNHLAQWTEITINSDDTVTTNIIPNDVILPSSTSGSTKSFKITVDDSGTITATEVTTA